jgi:hypothetical protein
MALKTVIETLDGVDDAVQQFYAQDDSGNYVLQVEGVDQHPEVANLKSAYERTKADKKAAADERDALKAKVEGLPEDFDPKEWEKLKKGGQADPQELVQLRQTLEAERDEWKGKYQELEGQTRKMTVERTLAETLAAQGVTNPTYQKAATAMLWPQAQLDDKGNAVVDTDMGPMPLADHVKRWVASEGKDFVTPPSGGGAKGNDRGSDPKQVTRSEFDAMDQHGRAEFSKSGGKVVDD